MPQTFPVNPLLSLNTDVSRPMADESLAAAILDRLIQAGVVTSRPQVVSGAYVFAGTRVPVYNLRDYLEAGDSLEVFLDSFPTVPRALAERAIEIAQFDRKVEASCS